MMIIEKLQMKKDINIPMLSQETCLYEAQNLDEECQNYQLTQFGPS